ncbi:MAG: AMP-binding protein [Blautia sp.]|nr:AMP-binding protein [Blautia sp.]
MVYQTLVEAVLSHGTNRPLKPALVIRGTVITYEELVRQLKGFASILKEEYRIRSGDRVMLTGLSGPEYLTAFLAVQYLHAVTIPLDKVWLEATVLKLYDFIEPNLILTDMGLSREDIPAVSLKSLYQRAREIPDPPLTGYLLPEPDAVAEMLFTTGTTGTPKGAMLTYRNILSITQNNREGTGFQETDVLLDALPLCHSLGLRLVRMSLYTGATAVIQNGFAFPKELKLNLEKYHCTAFVCVPATMEKLTRDLTDFSTVFGQLRLIEIGAGSLSYDMKKRLPKLLPDTQICNTWGSSETGGVIFLDVSHRPDKMKSLGRPVSSARIRVIGPSGEELHASDIDHAGRLAIQGQMTMAGYYKMPEVNQEALCDGWLVTNDLVYTDEEGFVYMLGRADDIINVGGEKVSPLEVENIAVEYEKILDAACIGVADPVMGQVPALFVEAEEPCSEKELRLFLAERMEPFKLPAHILKVREIPRNRMKKLDRKAVRGLWEARTSKSAADNVPDFIRMILSRQSIRLFTDQPIDRQTLELLVQAGIQAPSGKNRQTWRFTVITDQNIIQTIRETGSSVAEREKTGFFGFRNPAALILITNDSRNDNGPLDAACAAENILVSAHALGLGACWLNGLTRICDQPEIRQLLSRLSVPATHRVWAMIALGYPAEQPKPVPRKNNVVTWIE